MNFYEQQHRDIVKALAFKSDASSYFGRSCYIALGGGRLARLDFTTCGTYEKYESYEITILDKNKGCIDKLRLRFKDYFAAQPGECSEIVPYIWMYGGETKWYIQPTVSDVEKLAQAVRDYILLFA